MGGGGGMTAPLMRSERIYGGATFIMGHEAALIKCERIEFVYGVGSLSRTREARKGQRIAKIED